MGAGEAFSNGALMPLLAFLDTFHQRTLKFADSTPLAACGLSLLDMYLFAGHAIAIISWLVNPSPYLAELSWFVGRYSSPATIAMMRSLMAFTTTRNVASQSHDLRTRALLLSQS